MKNDPNYLPCKNKECKKFQGGKCVNSTCSGSIRFHVINIRSDIEFVFFSNGFVRPCLVGRSTPVSFANPKRPLYGHLSSIDSSGTSVSMTLLFLLQIFSVLYSHIFDLELQMRLTWVSGDKQPQQIQYGKGKAVTSTVSTFSQAEMCSE